MSTPLPRAHASVIGPVLGLALVAGYAVLVQQATGWGDYDLWGALVVLPLLVLAMVPLLLRAGRADPDPRFMRLLVVAFVLKCLATVARYWMAFVFYAGVADANGYDGAGERLAVAYRQGSFVLDRGPHLVGTEFIRVLTGAIYTVTGPSIYVAYAVYSLLGFWGLYFFYRAFQTAVPDGDHRRYAILVLFLPSMLFWPSGLGKEAWMTFGIGLASYGAARLLVGGRSWLLPLVVGLAATAAVRPHISAMLVAAIGVALVLRPSLRPATALTPLARATAAAAVVLVGLFFAHQAADFLGIQHLSVSGVESAVRDTQGRTSQGGSEFSSSPVRSVLDLPRGALTVLFRPWLFEAGNAQTLLAAAEGTLLVALSLLALPRLRGVGARLRRQPYLVLSLSYLVMFVYAFSPFANFGILTRQRVQVLPFLLVLLALPAVRRRPKPTAHRGERTSREETTP